MAGNGGKVWKAERALIEWSMCENWVWKLCLCLADVSKWSWIAILMDQTVLGDNVKKTKRAWRSQNIMKKMSICIIQRLVWFVFTVTLSCTWSDTFLPTGDNDRLQIGIFRFSCLSLLLIAHGEYQCAAVPCQWSAQQWRQAHLHWPSPACTTVFFFSSPGINSQW